MQTTEQVLLSLIRQGVFGEGETLDLTQVDFHQLYALSASQDMAHVVGVALEKYARWAESEVLKPFRKAKNMATFRFVQMENALAQIAALFEEAQIPFVPLKGSVIRHLYPDPTLRTSCDIDIFVAKEDLQNAVSLLEQKGGYTAMPQETGHDVSLYSVDQIHIELHFDLMEMDETMSETLSDAWAQTHPVEGKTYQKAFSAEMLLLYHIIHMAKHFSLGGCGIRPVLDLKILHNALTFDNAWLEERLEKANLLTFYRETTRLSEVWFGNSTHSPLTEEMQRYVFRGGVFGTMENHAQNSLAKRGRVGHFLRLLFPSAVYMKKRYPKAERHPILLPWFYLWRFICFLFKPHAKAKVKINLEVAKNGATEETRRHLWMMQQLEMDQNELL